MTRYFFSTEELNALFGSGPVAFTLYFHLRSRMDFETGCVGTKYKISIRGLEECCERHISRGAGFQIDRPSRKEIRVALAELVRRDLLERIGSVELLSFRMPLATTFVRQNQTGPSSGKVSANPSEHDASTQVTVNKYKKSDRQLKSAMEPSSNALPNQAYIRASVILKKANASRARANNSSQTPLSRQKQILQLLTRLDIDHSRKSKINQDDLRIGNWAKLNYTDLLIEKAYVHAVAERERELDDRPLNLGFLDVILKRIAKGEGQVAKSKEQRPHMLPSRQKWFMSWSGIEIMAAKLGLVREKDELHFAFKYRVFAAAKLSLTELRIAEIDRQ